MQVLKLDINCEDAEAELARVRTHQLMVSEEIFMNKQWNNCSLYSFF